MKDELICRHIMNMSSMFTLNNSIYSFWKECPKFNCCIDGISSGNLSYEINLDNSISHFAHLGYGDK